MKATVNPFTREVILDNGHESKTIQFTELDEWISVRFSDDSLYDIHFLYDEKFEVCAYLIDNPNDIMYGENVITKININI